MNSHAIHRILVFGERSGCVYIGLAEGRACVLLARLSTGEVLAPLYCADCYQGKVDMPST